MLRAESHVHTSPVNFPVGPTCAATGSAHATRISTVMTTTTLFISFPSTGIRTHITRRVSGRYKRSARVEVRGKTQVTEIGRNARASPVQELPTRSGLVGEAEPERRDEDPEARTGEA